MTTLESVVRFTAVAVNTPTTLPHGLNVSGISVTPDRFARRTTGTFTVSVSVTGVTVTNNGSAPADIDVWCKFIYSPERAFGANQTTVLPGGAFEIGGPSSGGGNGTYYGSCEVNNDTNAPAFLLNSDAAKFTGVASGGAGLITVTIGDAGAYSLQATCETPAGILGAPPPFTPNVLQSGPTTIDLRVYGSDGTLVAGAPVHLAVFGPY